MFTDDRRRLPRRVPVPGEPLRRARSRTGHELDVLDASQTGALVEGRVRLLPNTHLDVHLMLRSGRVLVRCRVVRAYVCHVEADLVRYRVGVAFDQPIDVTPGYSIPRDFVREFQAVGTTYPDPTGDAGAASLKDPPGS